MLEFRILDLEKASREAAQNWRPARGATNMRMGALFTANYPQIAGTLDRSPVIQWCYPQVVDKEDHEKCVELYVYITCLKSGSVLACL
jgi:hypothetical protein